MASQMGKKYDPARWDFTRTDGSVVCVDQLSQEELKQELIASLERERRMSAVVSKAYALVDAFNKQYGD